MTKIVKKLAILLVIITIALISFNQVKAVDLNLTENNIQTINKFIEYLEQFKFIRNGHEDVKVFSTDVQKTNNELSSQMACVKEKEVEKELFRDYTPKITVK